MASVITESIPEQRFETVRDQIALILGDELANQFDLQSEPLFNATIFIERITAIDKTEMPCLNVFFVRSNYSDQVTAASASKSDPATYYVDVYTTANETPETPGYQLAAFDLHKLLGAIRYILEHPAYMRLGFETTKFIHHTRVASIEIAEPKADAEAMNSCFGRLTFEVIFNEITAGFAGTLGQEFHTTIKIDTSEKGYKVIIPQI